MEFFGGFIDGQMKVLEEGCNVITELIQSDVAFRDSGLLFTM